MKNLLVVILVVVLLSIGASAKNKLTPIKVEVVEQSNGFQEKYNAALLRGRRTALEATTLKVVINDEHALLRCYENHQGCNMLGPGTYDGEPKIHKQYYGGGDAGKGDGPEVWIYYIQPLDHQKIREHWRVSGTW